MAEKFALLTHIYERKNKLLRSSNLDVTECSDCINIFDQKVFKDVEIFESKKDLSEEIFESEYKYNLGFLINPDFSRNKIGFFLNSEYIISIKEQENMLDEMLTQEEEDFLEDQTENFKEQLFLRKKDLKPHLNQKSDENFIFFANMHYFYSIKKINVSLDKFVIYHVEKSVHLNIYPKIPDYQIGKFFSIVYETTCPNENTQNLDYFLILRYDYHYANFDFLKFKYNQKEGNEIVERIFKSLEVFNLCFNPKYQLIVTCKNDYDIILSFMNTKQEKEVDNSEDTNYYFVSDANDYMYSQKALINHLEMNSKIWNKINKTIDDISLKIIDSTFKTCSCFFNFSTINFDGSITHNNYNCKNKCLNNRMPNLIDMNLIDVIEPSMLIDKLANSSVYSTILNHYYCSKLISIDNKITPLFFYFTSIILDDKIVSNQYKFEYYLKLIKSSNFIDEIGLNQVSLNCDKFKKLMENITYSISLKRLNISNINLTEVLSSNDNSLSLKNLNHIEYLNNFFINFNPCIIELCMDNCDIDDKICKSFTFMRKTPFKFLETLSLNNNFITSAGFSYIIEALKSNCKFMFKNLFLSNNLISSVDGISSFLPLQRLNIFGNPIKDKGASQLLDLFKLTSSNLQFLNVGKTELTFDFIEKFSSILKSIVNSKSSQENFINDYRLIFKENNTFEYINFSHIHLKENSLNMLSETCFNKSKLLHTLNLSDCNIKLLNKSFGNHMKFNESLKYLILDNNHLTSDSFNVLTDAVTFTKLLRLSLVGNKINDFKREYFVNMISKSECLQMLNLSGNHFNSESLKSMISIVKYYCTKSKIVDIDLSNQKKFQLNKTKFLNNLVKEEFKEIIYRRNYNKNESLNTNDQMEILNSIDYSNYSKFLKNYQEYSMLNNFMNEKVNVIKTIEEKLSEFDKQDFSYVDINDFGTDFNFDELLYSAKDFKKSDEIYSKLSEKKKINSYYFEILIENMEKCIDNTILSNETKNIIEMNKLKSMSKKLLNYNNIKIKVIL